MLTGGFCEQPPLALIKSIEMSGCYVVDDDFMLVTRWLLDEVPADGDPLQELSKAFLHRSASTAAKYDATREEKGVFLMKQVKTRGAEGVIFAAPSFCDPALLERPMLQDVLTKHGIPHTAFKYAENTGQMAPDPRTGRHLRRFDQALERRLRTHDMNTPIAMPTPTGSAKKPQNVQKEDAMWLQKELINKNYTELANARANNQKVVGHLRARQSQRAADVLQLRAQPARDQCAAERHAQEERQDDHGRRARRPERGRLHLRQGRPRHDARRRGRPQRRGAAQARHPAAAATPAASPS